MSGAQSNHDELAGLGARLHDAEELIRAIRQGEIDAIVVDTPTGEAIYTLSGAERPYRAFLDAMHEGAFTADVDGTILYANRAFASLVGRPLESLLGTSVRDFVGPLSVPGPSDGIASHEEELTTASGTHVPVSVSITRIDVEGQPVVAGIVRDLSRERLSMRLRESEERLSLAREAAGLGIHDYDVQRDVITWDARARELWGVDPHEAVTLQTFETGLHPDDLPAVRAAVQRAFDPNGSGIYCAEYRVVRRTDGRTFWVAATGRAVFVDGQPVRLVGTVQDVSARKHVEARQAFLLGLGDALRPLADPVATQSEACRRLAEFLDVARAYYVEIDEAAGVARVERDFVRGRAPSLAGEHPIADFAWSVDILRRGECHIIADTQTSPLVPEQDRPASAALGIVARVGAPIFKDGELVGALCVTDSRQRDWPESDVTLVREVGERIWAAIASTRAQKAVDARNRQLELLASTAERLLSDREVGPGLVEAIGGDIARLIDMESFFHYRLGAEPRVLVLAGGGGIADDERRLFATMRFGDLLCGRVAESRQRLIVEDLQHSTHPGSEILRGTGATSYAGFPLVANNDVLFGTLAFVSKRRTHLRRGDAQTIQTVCDQIALALQRTQLERDARASEERARVALDGGELGAWDVDLGSGMAVWSPRHAELQGYHGDGPFDLDNWRSLVHPDDREAVLAVMERARLERTAFSIEHRLHRADTGAEVWMAIHGRYSYDDEGRAVRVSGVSRDVTERVHAERSLQRADMRFQAFMEAAPHLVWECDGTGRCIYQGPQWQAYTGQPLEAALGYGWLEMVHPHDRAGAAEEWNQAQRSGVYAAEHRLHTAGGVYRWTLARARALRGADGGIVSWCGPSTDIHDLKEAKVAAEESERRFRGMADQTPIAMWVTDAAGDIEFVNHAYCEFFGVTLEQVRAPGGWQPLLHRSETAYAPAFAEALAARRPFQATARVRRADGEWRWIASVGHPRFSEDGTFLGMIGVSPDVTDQRRASEMEREAAQQKDQFIAVLAHELRNPLAPIRASVGVLRGTRLREATLARCRDIIDRQVTHMTRLLDDLLDVSRLSRGKLALRREAVRLHAVVAAAVETVRPLVDERRHRLTVDEIDASLMLEADPARLTQVLTNLLNNAAKYTEPEGSIAVTAERRGAQVVVRVRDTGVGLRADMTERIFDLFTQIEDTRHRADGGLGIGLGLAKRLTEMHGGTLTVHSDGPGHGSTFSVTLPVLDAARHEAGRPPDPASTDRQSARHRVLVVDDNVDAADTLALLLDMMGCDTRTVYDGESALREGPAFHPNLVLLDLGMPGLDGGAVCRRVREQAWGSKAVIAAVTGWGQEEDRRRTKTSGFDLHLVKPVDPRDLEALVRRLPPD
ncbi:MAG: PAS domain S-box protein [Vicinamibacterales bacterium]